MENVSDLKLKRSTDEVAVSIIIEQEQALMAGLAAFETFRRLGRREALRRFKASWENAPDLSFEKALGWSFHLRQLARSMRLAKAASQIPGVYKLIGKSVISHWFEFLSLREIDLVTNPVEAFGAQVEHLERLGAKSFQQHVREWRQTRARGKSEKSASSKSIT